MMRRARRMYNPWHNRKHWHLASLSTLLGAQPNLGAVGLEPRRFTHRLHSLTSPTTTDLFTWKVPEAPSCPGLWWHLVLGCPRAPWTGDKEGWRHLKWEKAPSGLERQGSAVRFTGGVFCLQPSRQFLKDSQNDGSEELKTTFFYLRFDFMKEL